MLTYEEKDMYPLCGVQVLEREGDVITRSRLVSVELSATSADHHKRRVQAMSFTKPVVMALLLTEAPATNDGHVINIAGLDTAHFLKNGYLMPHMLQSPSGIWGAPIDLMVFEAGETLPCNNGTLPVRSLWATFRLTGSNSSEVCTLLRKLDGYTKSRYPWSLYDAMTADGEGVNVYVVPDGDVTVGAAEENAYLTDTQVDELCVVLQRAKLIAAAVR